MEGQRKTLLLCFAALALSIGLVEGIVDPDLQRRCQAQGTCRECIRQSPDCVWCSENIVSSSARRCNAIDRSNESSVACAQPLEDPTSQLVNTIESTLGELIQVTPQRVNVTVRPGSPVVFDVGVRPANNFPIDLYLLMDLSFSMNDDLNNLKRLGTQLAERISTISNNFTLGFGSFVDKRRGSFVNLDPRRLADPCRAGCEAPYSYRHVVSLTEDGDFFSNRVNEQVISGNQDFPEGGFDGFMQSIVCTKAIGWRAVSRKILLYISDAGFHFAGDGLLGGVIKPNDGKCYMGESPATSTPLIYNRWDELDYPSIGQIAEKLDEFDIIPIFAVVRDFQELYELLRAELGNRAFLGELATDSSNVVDLVEQLYDEISTSVAFSPVNVPGISVTATLTQCETPRDGACLDVQSGEDVTFRVSVDVTECTPELQAGPREVELRVLGFGAVMVELNAICDCGCDSERVVNSSECNNQGTQVCGICECNRGYFGDRCQCDSTGTSNGNNIDCPLGLGNRQCSDRGTCTCGICDCRTTNTGEERFYGLACECDNTVCTVGTGNEICSGPSQGECTCDGCRCLIEPVTGLPYTKDDCSCTPNTQTCIDPTNNTDVCNGRGVCECGECVCNPNSPYFGDLCELCSGDEVCRLQTCAVDGDNTLCASCVIDILEQLNNAGVNETLFTPEGLEEAIVSGTLPGGSNLTMVTYGNGLTAMAIILPPEFSTDCSASVSVMCPQSFFIVNETMEMEYEIEEVLSVRCALQQDCIYPYYVSIDEMGNLLPIHIGFPPACPEQRPVGGSSGIELDLPPWAIALIIIGILFLLGILALVLLKLLLVFLDYIELKKFEKELDKIKYTKNENPLYHSATTEHKNPIYGQ